MPTTLSCSFCLKPAPEVEQLIAGPGIYICDACVALCQEILAAPKSPSDPPRVLAWDQIDDDKMLETLPRIAAVATQVETSLNDWVGELRRRGVTWTRIGEALGMTRQSAWGRFSPEE